MKQKIYIALWGGMFIICAILGFIPDPMEPMARFRTACLFGFFLMPALLVLDARKKKNRNLLRVIRNLAASSLVLTAVLLMANFASVTASEAVGDVLYILLVILSSPMICGGRWVVSLFLWACLLILATKESKKNG